MECLTPVDGFPENANHLQSPYGKKREQILMSSASPSQNVNTSKIGFYDTGQLSEYRGKFFSRLPSQGNLCFSSGKQHLINTFSKKKFYSMKNLASLSTSDQRQEGLTKQSLSIRRLQDSPGYRLQPTSASGGKLPRGRGRMPWFCLEEEDPPYFPVPIPTSASLQDLATEPPTRTFQATVDAWWEKRGSLQNLSCSMRGSEAFLADYRPISSSMYSLTDAPGAGTAATQGKEFMRTQSLLQLEEASLDSPDSQCSSVAHIATPRNYCTARTQAYGTQPHASAYGPVHGIRRQNSTPQSESCSQTTQGDSHASPSRPRNVKRFVQRFEKLSREEEEEEAKPESYRVPKGQGKYKRWDRNARLSSGLTVGEFMEKFNKQDSMVIGTCYHENLRYGSDWDDAPRRHTIQGREQREEVTLALAFMDQALAAIAEQSETVAVFAGYAGRAKCFQHGEMTKSSEHAGTCLSQLHDGMASSAMHAGIVSRALHDEKATMPERDEKEAKMEQDRLERERQEKEEQEAARRKETQEKKKKGKRKGLGGLSPEKKKMLKKLIMQKAAEDLRNEAKRKAEEKEAFINSRVEPLKVEGLSQGQLQTMVKNLHSRVASLEEEVYDWEVKIRKQDWEINELTLKVNDTKGKFIKPVLRKVNKTEGKLAKLEKKDTRDFRTTLKSTGQNKFGLDEKEEEDKPDWRGELKKGEEEAAES